MAWVAELALLALRQAQLARRWRRQEALALQLEDVGEAHFSPRVLPFLEQAQQKISASKWADGPATQPVQRRVAALARDQNGCAAALEACRRTRHALRQEGGGCSSAALHQPQLALAAAAAAEQPHRPLRALRAAGAGRPPPARPAASTARAPGPGLDEGSLPALSATEGRRGDACVRH